MGWIKDSDTPLPNCNNLKQNSFASQSLKEAEACALKEETKLDDELKKEIKHYSQEDRNDHLARSEQEHDNGHFYKSAEHTTKQLDKSQDQANLKDSYSSDSKKPQGNPKDSIKKFKGNRKSKTNAYDEEKYEDNGSDNEASENPFMEDQPTFGYMEDPEKDMKDEKKPRKQQVQMKMKASSNKPVFHFEEHDGDWGDDDWKHWKQAAEQFHGDEDLDNWEDYEPEKVAGKLISDEEDQGHFFTHVEDV